MYSKTRRTCERGLTLHFEHLSSSRNGIIRAIKSFEQHEYFFRFPRTTPLRKAGQIHKEDRRCWVFVGNDAILALFLHMIVIAVDHQFNGLGKFLGNFPLFLFLLLQVFFHILV